MGYVIGTGAISGSFSLDGSIVVPISDLGITALGTASWRVVVGGVSFQGSATTGPEGGSAVELNISVTTDFGDASMTVSPSGPEYTASLGGEISVTIPFDLVLTINQLGGDDPFYASIVDSPPYQEVVLSLVINGPISGSVSWAGLPTVSGTVSRVGEPLEPAVTLAANAVSSPAQIIGESGYGPAGQSTISVTGSANVPSAGVPTESAGESGTDPATGLACSSSATASPGGASATSTNAAEASAVCAWNATRQFSLSGVVRAMEAAYTPDGLTLQVSRYAGDATPNVTVASGAFTQSGTQAEYDVSAGAAVGTEGTDFYYLDGPNTALANTFQPIAVVCAASALTANGDDPDGNRVLLHGPTCEGMTIAQASSWLVDGWTTGTVTGSGSGSGTVDGGALTITTDDSGAGGVTRAYSTPVSLASYRYLQFTLQALVTDNIPVRVGIGSYHWDMTTGTVADGPTTITLDVLAPSDGTATSDTTDTHWPIPTPTAQQTQMFGPYVVYDITFDQIPASCEVEIGTLNLVRMSDGTVDCLPTLYDSTYDPDSGSVSPDWPTVENVGGTKYVRRFFLASSDGRQTVEEYDVGYDGGSFDMRSITDLATSINANDVGPTLIGTLRWPGWTATPDVPTATGATGGSGILTASGNLYVASVLNATYLYGGGALAVAAGSGADGWQYGFDLSLGEIPAQLLFDQITLCGLEGDIFGFGGSAGSSEPETTTFLRASLIVRAAAHGIALTSAGDPATNAYVTLSQGGSVVSWGMTDDTSGRYHTSRQPEATVPPGVGYVQAPATSLAPVEISPLYTRHRHRASLVVPPPPPPPELYFPFPVQFSDPNSVPVEEWRRVPSEQTGPPGTPEAPAPPGGSPSSGGLGGSGAA
jgi:hypothetical protein